MSDTVASGLVGFLISSSLGVYFCVRALTDLRMLTRGERFFCTMFPCIWLLVLSATVLHYLPGATP